MARSFNTGTVDDALVKSSISTFPVTAWPITMAAWVYFPSDPPSADETVVFGLADNSVSNQAVWISLLESSSNMFVRLVRYDGGTADTLNGVTNLANSTWHHIAAVISSNTDAKVYRNGVQDNTTAVSRAFPTGLDVISIGQVTDSSPINNSVGNSIAEVGLWSAALSVPELGSLAAGTSPMMIRPSSLAGYWPVHGETDPESDFTGANHLTEQGDGLGPEKANHAPVGRQVVMPSYSPNKTGSLGGVVTVGGLLVRRLIRVKERDTGALVAETFSDASTGEWQVTGLNRDKQYFAVMLDV